MRCILRDEAAWLVATNARAHVCSPASMLRVTKKPCRSWAAGFAGLSLSAYYPWRLAVNRFALAGGSWLLVLGFGLGI